MNRRVSLLLFCVGISPFLVNGAFNAALYPGHPWLFWLLELASWVVLPTILFTVARERWGLHAADLGLHGRIRGRRSIPLLVLACVMAGPIYFTIYARALSFFSGIVSGPPMFSYQSVVPDSGQWRIVVAVYLAATAGVVEEAYFRGFFFKLSGLFASPRTVYLAASPVLFALVHWEGTRAGLPATYVLGVAAAAGYLWLGNLWPLVVGHVFTDLVWFLEWRK
jgi:hypothetical protein